MARAVRVAAQGALLAASPVPAVLKPAFAGVPVRLMTTDDVHAMARRYGEVVRLPRDQPVEVSVLPDATLARRHPHEHLAQQVDGRPPARRCARATPPLGHHRTAIPSAGAAPRSSRFGTERRYLCVPAQMLGMKGVCYNPEVKRATRRGGA